MAQRNIVTKEEPLLYKKSRPVKAFDARLHQLLDDMAETLLASGGVGLAAPQVNVHKRLVVIDVSEDKNALMVLVNPQILAQEGTQEYEEGCLSVPGVYSKITRAARVRVQAQNLDGEPFEIEADGLLAVCLQHEIDHLDGKVFVDYLSQLKQNRIRTKLLKQAREGARS